MRFFQYRDKQGSRRSIYETCLGLARIARSGGALLLVNDHADIAVAVDAAGVHLGQDDLPIAAARHITGPDRIIGISTHGREEAAQAEQSGADYIGFGPMFPTLTKDAGRTQNLEALRSIRQAVGIPVVAIGGINHGNCRQTIESGADGIAVISAILRADDIQESARCMMKLISP